MAAKLMSEIGCPWRVEDLAFDRIDRSTVVGDDFAFKVVATASFIETGSDLYATNLREFFRADREVGDWLSGAWEPEELRHGCALRAYVEHVWPAFDWEHRFRSFLDEYGRTCTVPDLESTQALELAARCIVEMGTSALYRAIHGYASEPVLKEIAARIYADEVRHYKMFYRHFRRYQRREGRSRWRVGRTVVKRLLATRTEDGRCAYGHVWDFAVGSSDDSFETSYRAFSQEAATVLRRHGSSDMMARMILKPLELPSPIVDAATRISGPLYGLWLNAGQ